MSLLRDGIPITTVALGEELELRWTIDERARRGPDDELLGFLVEARLFGDSPVVFNNCYHVMQVQCNNLISVSLLSATKNDTVAISGLHRRETRWHTARAGAFAVDCGWVST